MTTPEHPSGFAVATCFSLLLATLSLSTSSRAAMHVETEIEEIIVTSQRRPQAIIEHTGNVERLSYEELDRTRHQHVHELMGRVSGVWLSRGSGPESLTAIRSPVLTGAGSCGAFLTLEDSIPSRPAGFCNVNQIFELNTEQAQSIEVIRGPGNALYGSNALHGIINVIMPKPGDPVREVLALELGANDYYRLRVRAPFPAASPAGASIVLTDDGGFRDDSGYRQSKGHFKYRSRFFWRRTDRCGFVQRPCPGNRRLRRR